MFYGFPRIKGGAWFPKQCLHLRGSYFDWKGRCRHWHPPPFAAQPSEDDRDNDNKENDYDFYECETTPIKVSAGMFTIFFPEDLHMPCIKAEESSYVKKVVVKVKI